MGGLEEGASWRREAYSEKTLQTVKDEKEAVEGWRSPVRSSQDRREKATCA
tara:strand:- start:90 stop:242 length:153 start_codon:yes stop_codon:yes gene_type:complete